MSGSRPTILWLLANPLAPGGTVTHFANLAQVIDTSEFRIVACAPNFDEPAIASPFAGTDVKLVSLPALRRRSLLYAPAVLGVAKVMRRESIDLIHSVWAKGDVLGAMSAMLAGVPHQVSSLEVYYLATGGLRRAAYRVLFSLFTGRRLDRVIALSERSEAEFRAQVPYRGHVEVIPLGIDLDAFPRLAPRQKDGAVVYGALGRMIPEKGFDVLIEAFASVASQEPRARLLLGGDGPEAPALRSIVDRLGLGARVEMLGWTSNVRAFFEAIDVFVFPSRPSFDGLPHVVLESMSFGRTVIATDVGGVSAVVEDGSTGFLVPPEDPGRLARAMLSAAADGGPTLAAAAARVREGHDRRREAADVTRVYREVLARGRR